MTACALLRTATTAAGTAASTAAATVALIATTGVAGLYAVGSSVGPARRTVSHPTAAVTTHASATQPSATHAALARVVGSGLASRPLPEVRARVTAALDRHVERLAALAAKVGTSERLSIAQRARATERLAAARAELADLRADVRDQTSGEGLARVLTEAHRHRVFWRNWTLEREVALARLTATADPAAPGAA